MPLKWCLLQDKLGPRESQEPMLRMEVAAHERNPEGEMDHWWGRPPLVRYSRPSC